MKNDRARWRTRFDAAACLKLHPLTVAAAIVGSAAIGAVGSSIASSNAADAANKSTEAQAAAAAGAQDIGREQLAWDKEQYYADKSLRDQAATTSIGLMQQQAKLAERQQGLADEYADYNRQTFRPLEQKIVANAQAFDTPERRAAAAEAARADVEGAFGSAQAGLGRSLARAGAAPSGGRSLSLMQDAALAKAGALAGATTSATRNVETIGAARMADAANLGRNLPSAQATAAATGISAANSATAAGTAAVNQSAAGIPAVNAGYAGAMSGTLGAGTLYGQGANNYMQQAAMYANIAGQATSGIGTYLGTPGGQAWMARLAGGG